jgi:hypothetical protein
VYIPPMAETNTPAVRRPVGTITVAVAARKGLVPLRMTSEALNEWLPADGSLRAVWDRVGNVHGEVEYGISHFRRSEGGPEIVREDGTVVIRYPLGQGRYVRILGKSS